ncbi:pentatricopeptide repeat-containing protein At5g09450, mitochondrial [Andrographis paniculata]|uniref:pentatricopeptide repeat-containing protein At5g09450, mitochondrial n=1 Tax=Andrographis paniculata TaxID=175694 RepID=UPI0021E89DA9|nr:pentatricopeptide repeat-containing protein At5g09450, mitochondrial [Andrographis paniculata]
MAVRSVFLTLARNVRRDSNIPFRGISSSVEAMKSESSAIANDGDVDGLVREENDDLRSKILRLRLPKRSATNVLQNWVDDGNRIAISELRSICNELRKSNSFKHALEISEWMVSHEEYKLTETDYAIRIDLMTKVFGVNAAERYFEGLPSSAKTRETYTALLHCYARLKLTEQAEDLFEQIKCANLPLTAITYNELMTFYISVGQLEKVPPIIEEMKRQNVALDLFTYNLWLTSHAAALSIDDVKKILREMNLDTNLDHTWTRYLQLAEIYLSSSRLMNSDPSSVMENNKAIMQRQLISYDFLFVLYGGLGDKSQIDKIWKSTRMMTGQNVSGRNYVCVISSYLMLGHLEEVARIVDEWKQSAASEFNLSMCRRLLEAYEEAGMADKATSFHVILKKKGYEPLLV